MAKLAEPRPAVASRILTEVGFNEHIMGYQLSERGGAKPMKLYSFVEVVNLLTAPHPRIDFDKLAVWVREAMDDAELATALERVCRQDVSDQEKSLQCRELMAQRLEQSKALA